MEIEVNGRVVSGYVLRRFKDFNIIEIQGDVFTFIHKDLNIEKFERIRTSGVSSQSNLSK
jgi:hypothetical protein